MDEELFHGFNFGRAPSYQAPSIRPPPAIINQGDPNPAPSSVSGPLAFANERSFFPGTNRVQDARVPFDVLGKPTAGSGDSSMNDSGRKSMMQEEEKEVDARIGDVSDRETEDQFMEPPEIKAHGKTTEEAPIHHPVRNAFQVASFAADQQLKGAIPKQHEQHVTALPISAARGLFKGTDIASKQIGAADSTQHPASTTFEDEAFSQTLPLPSQSFVHDTYQTPASLSTSMDVDVEGDEESAKSYVAESQAQGPASEPEKGFEEARLMDMCTAPVLADPIALPERSVSRAADRPDDQEPPTATIAAEKIMPSVSDASESGNESHKAQASYQAGTAAMATPQQLLEVDLVHPRPIHRSEQMPLVEPFAIDTALPRRTPTTREENAQARPLVNRDVAHQAAPDEPHGTQSTKKILHRSTSSSRSGRVLPSKKLGATQSLVNLEADNAFQPLLAGQVPDVTNAVKASKAFHPGDHETPSVPSKISLGDMVIERRANPAQGNGDAFAQPLASSHHTSKGTNAPTSNKAKLREPAKDLITGNARFQQRIRQSTNHPLISAQQLKEARAAALPPVDLRGMTNAINLPFVTPSSQEKETHLQTLLSRSSSPSFARPHTTHPRAARVQERRAHNGIPAFSPSVGQQKLKSSLNGSQDEKLAINLIFRAKEREAEITKLKEVVTSLEGRNSSLEKVNAELLVKNSQALDRNEKVLSDKKAAIDKARELVARSQEVGKACQSDLQVIRQSWSSAVKDLGMTKKRLDEYKSELVSELGPIRKDIKALKQNARELKESGEPVILAQLRAQIETLGQTAVDLQGNLEDERTAKMEQHKNLDKALEDIKLVTECNLRLIKENGDLQRRSSNVPHGPPPKEPVDTILRVVEEEDRLEAEREVLYLKIEHLESENTALLDQQYMLELSLAQATTLMEAFEAQLVEKKSDYSKLEETYKKDQDEHERTCFDLEDLNDRLKSKVKKLTKKVIEADRKHEELQALVHDHAEKVDIVQKEYTDKLQAQEELSNSVAEELKNRLKSMEGKLERANKCLQRSETETQQKQREKDMAIAKTRELDDLLAKLRLEYEKSLQERNASLSTGLELTAKLREKGEANLKLEREKTQLDLQLEKSNTARSSLESELWAVKDARRAITAEYQELEEKYSTLKDELEELEKRAEDGKAAHQEDVTRERAKYEELKAQQDSLKERYQTGELTTSERDLLKLHVEKIQANHDDAMKKLKNELTAAQTDASLWRKTAGRAANEKSQKMGGRSLIGSDFDDPSSSPREPLRSAMTRREPEPAVNERDMLPAFAHTPSSPLTAVNTSSEKQDYHEESQSLSSFLTGRVSVNKRVSFQEMAGNGSDEMDNDVPDTLGKIAEDDDDREEDIEESESLMDAVTKNNAHVTSSIGNYTQPAARSADVHQASIGRMDVSVPEGDVGKNVTSKGSKTSLGMTRSTRSSSHLTTYSGASRKRGGSVLAGNDMESFTSTQEDAIYAKRSVMKKQRRSGEEWSDERDDEPAAELALIRRMVSA